MKFSSKSVAPWETCCKCSITDMSGMQTNYISHWLLTHHLLPLLQKTSAATSQMTRLVNVTSDGHERLAPAGGIKFDDLGMASHNAMVRYGQSKLANVLHAKELHRRYGPGASGTAAGSVCTAAVHPGHIDTYVKKRRSGRKLQEQVWRLTWEGQKPQQASDRRSAGPDPPRCGTHSALRWHIGRARQGRVVIAVCHCERRLQGVRLGRVRDSVRGDWHAQHVRAGPCAGEEAVGVDRVAAFRRGTSSLGLDGTFTRAYLMVLVS